MVEDLFSECMRVQNAPQRVWPPREDLNLKKEVLMLGIRQNEKI